MIFVPKVLIPILEATVAGKVIQVRQVRQVSIRPLDEAMKGRPAAIFCADAESLSGEPSMKVGDEPRPVEMLMAKG